MDMRVSGFFLFFCLWAVPEVLGQAETTVEKLKAEFAVGRSYFEKQDYARALDVFEKILVIDPQARGSLLLSSISRHRLGQYQEAGQLIDQFLTLEKNHVSGIIAGIQIHQALGSMEKVHLLRKRLFQLKAAGADRRLGVMLNYEREIIPLEDELKISILEHFPSPEDGPLFQGVIIRGTTIKRRLEWIEATGSTLESLKQIYPEASRGSVYVLGEPIYKVDDLLDYKIRSVQFRKLEYQVVRDEILNVLQVKK